MSSKQDKIKKILEMQKKFIERDRAKGIYAEEYFTHEEGSELDGYRQEYLKTAEEVVTEAHEEKGSHAQIRVTLNEVKAAHVAAFFMLLS